MNSAGGRARRRLQPIASAQVAAQRPHRARVQRQLARLAELAVAHEKEVLLEVDVAAVEADRLPDPQTADREQADQRPVGRDPQRETQRAGGREQRRDLLLGI